MHDASAPTSTRATLNGGSESGNAQARNSAGPGAVAWTAALLQEGFERLQGELAPCMGDGGSPDAPPIEHDHALQERVRELSRSAIEIFRSELQLFRKQQHREKSSGGANCSRGMLVLFEGLDRSGKGTQVQRLVIALKVAICLSVCARLS